MLGTAISIGFVHTLIGVDHSLPFILIGKARAWSLRKVLTLTTLCGFGHVVGSVLRWALGIGLVIGLEKIEWIETSRGELASNLLICFGVAYGAYALWQALQNKGHNHAQTHGTKGKALTTWSLFLLFVFGPCEALIPLLMAPAAQHHWFWVLLVAGAFSLTTIGTMVGVVACGYLGLNTIRMVFLERYGMFSQALPLRHLVWRFSCWAHNCTTGAIP